LSLETRIEKKEVRKMKKKKKKKKKSLDEERKAPWARGDKEG